ncbi:SusC/RagA family TonB-linked outer membrane protein [Larkinella soli]|uniref:SusC/RagA family TonB-linked outer membrane protein n=1 Tax=Larkinella soli TaxID=1770527 RepID=UPI000FFC9562|nr:TonB-dependent receptor [Larkinella soli]
MVKFTNFLYCLCLLLILSGSGLAQSLTLTGRVTNGPGRDPLPGVNVSVEGTTVGTTTDAEGTYRLNLPSANRTVVFSYIGYVSQRVEVGSRTQIDIAMEEDNKSLSEVVVVGYGTVRKSDLTGSLASVKPKELTAFPTTSVVQALAGRAPGVQVIQNNGSPGAPVSVRIRGTNSIQGNNEPLYVIDGFPFSGNPNLLNNADIESIEILKDASATAIYGSRGANGVVLITTKRGKAGRTQVNYEGSYSHQTLRKKLDLLSPQEYVAFYNEQAVNDGLSPYFNAQQIQQVAALGAGTDWQDVVMKPAPLHNHAINVSGGSEKTQFSIGGSLLKQGGIIVNSNFDRYALRANVNHDISPKFSLSYSTNLSRIQTNRKNTSIGNRGSGLITAMISAPPTLSPYNDDGTYRNLSTAYPFISNVMVNPLNFLEQQSDVLRSNRVLANAAVTYKPVAGLSIRISGGVENADDRTDGYTTRQFVNSQGTAGIGTQQYVSLLNENVVSYVRDIGRHSLSVTGALTYQDFKTTGLSASGSGFVSDISETYDLAAAALFNTPETRYTFSTLLSYLGRVNYSFNNRYLLTASFRADGSSRYSEGNKWGYFPSAALAWRVTEEAFMKQVPFISDLKIRAGFGATGSQAISPYATLNSLSSGKTVFDDALFTTYAPGTRLPGNLRWETTVQTDIGIDAAFLNNRLRLTADYYVKNTRDLLNSVQLPSSLGYTSTIRNVGEIQNRGLELSLDAGLFSGGADRAGFRWDVSANIAFNRNKVVKLYNGQDINGTAFFVGPLNDFVNILREGQPLGVFYGYRQDGYTDKGNLKYADLNADGAINAKDKTYLGDPNPDFIYGFNSTMAFRGFELTAFFQGSQGNDIFNLNLNQTLDLNFGMNMPRDMVGNTWTPTNPNAKYPRISRTIAGNISDRFVEDGSYLRLRNIQLAYNLPAFRGLRSAQVYVSGQNLLTLTKYSWYDPEINTYGSGNSINLGIDHYSYPTMKAVTVGVRLGF